MDQKYCAELARIRLERAIELLDESEDLLKKEKYKSANNRSYYAMEKAIKALLAMKGVDAATHSGNLKQFNYFYVFHGDGTFTPDDYQTVAAAEQIRNLSDYITETGIAQYRPEQTENYHRHHERILCGRQGAHKRNRCVESHGRLTQNDPGRIPA